MRILIIYRHYWPDATSYAWLLKAIAERFAAVGHQVTVVTAQPSYNDIKQAKRPRREMIGGVQVVRFPLLPERKSNLLLRLTNSLLFFLAAVFRGVVAGPFDLAMTVSNPPILLGQAARLIRLFHRTPFIIHCQDIHPEAAVYGGKIKQRWLAEFLKKLDTCTLKEAWRAVVLSDDMADTLRRRGYPGDNIAVINNFSLNEAKEHNLGVPLTLQKDPGKFRVLFAGNLGVFQGLPNVMEAARLLGDYPDIEFLFLGEGDAKSSLVKQAGGLLDHTVRFHDFVPMPLAFKVMQEADLGLVTLQPRVYEVAYPSKTMMLLAAGCPVLVTVEEQSQLSSQVLAKGVGLSCPQDDPRAMADRILQAYRDRQEWRARRERIMAVAEQEFGQGNVLARWEALLAENHPTGRTSGRNRPDLKAEAES